MTKMWNFQAYSMHPRWQKCGIFKPILCIPDDKNVDFQAYSVRFRWQKWGIFKPILYVSDDKNVGISNLFCTSQM